MRVTHIFLFFFKTMNTTPIEERVEQAWAGFPLSLRNLSCSTNEIAIYFSLAYLVNILEYFHNTHANILGRIQDLCGKCYQIIWFVSSVINLKHSDILVCPKSCFTQVIMKNRYLPRSLLQWFFLSKILFTGSKEC